jgi:galactonate dehydratase
LRITSIETFLVQPRWLFCKISTDDGISGWGEASLEGRSETVRTAVGELAELLIGKDPARIEDHWQLMTKGAFYRGGPVFSSAVAGIDQALWDIAGKVHGVPVYQLLGGPVRERMRMYTWVGGDEPSELKDSVAEKVDAGFTAIKMNASGRMAPLASRAEIEGVQNRVHAARDVLGPDRDVAIDFHGRVSFANAARLIAALAPLDIMFVEEPVLPEQVGQLRHLVGTVPLAAGERLYGRADFLPVLQAGIAVAQPDLSHAGGVSEVRRIASLAEIFGVALAPHCPLGPIALAACLQIDFATPNAVIQEQSLGIHYNVGSDLLDYLVDTSVFAFREGYVDRPTGPGLGIDVDEAAVRRADELGHAWRSPTWRHKDGSFAEW